MTAEGFHITLQTVKEKQPDIVLLENSPELDGKVPEGEKNDLTVLKELLSQAGYLCKHWIFSALDHGSPVERERLYVVGIRCKPNIQNLLGE